MTGSFGETGAGVMGDVNGDGGVNIFGLVIVVDNFSLTLKPGSGLIDGGLLLDDHQDVFFEVTV